MAKKKEKKYHDNDGSSGSGAEKKERGSNGRLLWTMWTAWQLVVTVEFGTGGHGATRGDGTMRGRDAGKSETAG